MSLLYKSPQDPQIEKDMVRMEAAFAAFEEIYRPKSDYSKDEKALRAALEAYEELTKVTASMKPLTYFWFIKELDSDNSEAEARIRLYEERLTKASNRIQFFDIALGKIPLEQQKIFLESEMLTPYRYFLHKLFKAGRHMLSEPEEKLMALKSGPSTSMWITGVNNAINRGMLTFKGKRISLGEGMNSVSKMRSSKDRQKLWSEITRALKEVSDFSESEMNAVFTDKKISDELRGFKNAYDATILGYENDPNAVHSLVATVTKNFAIAHRFFAVKKKMLKLSKLTYADRAASVGTSNRKFNFDEAVELTRESFEKADPQYAAILDSYLTQGQIDVYPKKGKDTGAFCAGSYDLPTYVLLNHVDELRSVTTLGHEMGHAIHTERSKTQPVFYYHYSTAVAETASTFFEGLVFERIIRDLPERERVIILHDKLQDEIATIFRQIAFFNFELDLHTQVRTKGWVPKTEIAATLNKHMAAYLGKAVTLQPDDGYFFIAVSHFRRPFYVYSYAYGELISRALRARVKADPSYITKVDQFLCAGSSKSPEQIFADIGIEVGPKLFEEGLKSIEADVTELERLVKKR